jgi:hypothetical protein
MDNQTEQTEQIPFKHRVLARQLDLISMEALETPITIIGAGAIGSFTTLSLAKMGYEHLTIYDFDTIEEANMNSQFYRLSDVGKPKVEALSNLVKDFTGVEITAKNQRYENGTFKGIVISAVDSMAIRKLLWDQHKYSPFGVKLYIDGRMGAEFAACYAMKLTAEKDVKAYENTLYSDEDAVQERCTAKATMYCVLSLASHIAKVVKDFTSNQPYARTLQWNIAKNKQELWNSDYQKPAKV